MGNDRHTDPAQANKDPRYWENLTWLEKNMPHLSEKHRGKWIVVADSAVVSETDTMRDARAYVKANNLGWVAVIWHIKEYLNV